MDASAIRQALLSKAAQDERDWRDLENGFLDLFNLKNRFTGHAKRLLEAEPHGVDSGRLSAAAEMMDTLLNILSPVLANRIAPENGSTRED